MMICVTSEENSSNANVSSRFGRSKYFLFFESDKNEISKIVENSAISVGRGAGISAAQEMVEQKVNVVITGRVGPNAFNALSSSGIKIYDGTSFLVKEAVEKFKKGELDSIEKALAGPGFNRQG